MQLLYAYVHISWPLDLCQWLPTLFYALDTCQRFICRLHFTTWSAWKTICASCTWHLECRYAHTAHDIPLICWCIAQLLLNRSVHIALYPLGFHIVWLNLWFLSWFLTCCFLQWRLITQDHLSSWFTIALTLENWSEALWFMTLRTIMTQNVGMINIPHWLLNWLGRSLPSSLVSCHCLPRHHCWNLLSLLTWCFGFLFTWCACLQLSCMTLVVPGQLAYLDLALLDVLLVFLVGLCWEDSLSLYSVHLYVDLVLTTHTFILFCLEYHMFVSWLSLSILDSCLWTLIGRRMFWTLGSTCHPKKMNARFSSYNKPLDFPSFFFHATRVRHVLGGKSQPIFTIFSLYISDFW